MNDKIPTDQGISIISGPARDNASRNLRAAHGLDEPMPTAVDVAMSKSEPRPCPLSDALINEVFRTGGQSKREFPKEVLPKPVITEPGSFIDWMCLEPARPELFSNWENLRQEAEQKFPESAHLFPASPEGLMGTDLFALALPEEEAKLREIQSRMQRLVETMAPYSMTAVGQRIAQMQSEHDAAVDAGTEPGREIMPTREAVARDSMSRLSSYTKLLQRICHEEAIPICKVILSRLDSIVCRFLRRIEISDREACAIKGLQYEPSLEWRAAANFLISQRVRLPLEHAWATPRQILNHIIEL